MTTPRRALGWFGRCALTSLLVALTLPAPASGATRMKLDDGSIVLVTDRQEIFLEALPQRGEGLLAFAERFCDSTRVASQIAEANGGRKRLLKDVRVKVPFGLLAPRYQMAVAQTLFADDLILADGWQHRVKPPSVIGAESLWRIAEWFTGDGENYREIRAVNRLSDDHLEPGQRLLIPAELLRPAFRDVLPPPSPYRLEYGADEQGEYATYELARGEALYSSVVVRFAGLVYADDVNSLAAEIAERNRISDVTDIPVGYRVKIPLKHLLPEYLPVGHPRRREWAAGVMAASQFSNQIRSKRLQGITVILDAGHGGRDVGASIDGVWESVYAYDLMLRVKKLLEESTAATVFATTRDGSEFTIPDADSLPFSRGHTVLTTPPYEIDDSSVGVNLRWYLANSLYRSATASADPQKVVFVSIHANALHPSLRGLMVYTPGAKLRGGSYKKSGSVYATRKEYKESPQVRFSSRQLTESEGLSRQLAHQITTAFARNGIAVHPDKPVRNRIVRKGRSFVPAVLRYNQVPAQVLLEVCNIANAHDRSLLQKRAFRAKVAESIVAGILDYYGHAEEGDRVQIAASTR